MTQTTDFMNEITSNKVLGIFDKHRKESGTAFDQAYFLDFLLKQPKHKGTFRNSFSGLRRYHKFIDETQLQFGICFSLKDLETNYSLSAFCLRIEKLTESNRSSKASLRNRSHIGFDWNIFLIANAILIGLTFACSNIRILLAIICLGIFYLNFNLITYFFKEKKYLNELATKINNMPNKS